MRIFVLMTFVSVREGAAFLGAAQSPDSKSNQTGQFCFDERAVGGTDGACGQTRDDFARGCVG